MAHYHQPASRPGNRFSQIVEDSRCLSFARLDAPPSPSCSPSATVVGRRVLGLLRLLHRRQERQQGHLSLEVRQRDRQAERGGTRGRDGQPVVRHDSPEREVPLRGRRGGRQGRRAGGRVRPRRQDRQADEAEREQERRAAGRATSRFTRRGRSRSSPTTAAAARRSSGSARTARSSSGPTSFSTRGRARIPAARKEPHAHCSLLRCRMGEYALTVDLGHRQGEGVQVRRRRPGSSNESRFGRRHAARFRPAAHRHRPGWRCAPTSAASSTRP